MKSVSEYMRDTGLTQPWYDPFDRLWMLRNPFNQAETLVVPADSKSLVDTPYGPMVRYE